jgi:hypothetical protein
LNQTRQYFQITFLIHTLTRSNKFLVNDSLTLVEYDQHHFDFWLKKSKLFVAWRAWRAPFHFCISVWGSYWKHQVSSPVTTESTKEESSSTDWMNSWQACSLRAFCSSKQCRTHLAQISRYSRSSIKILWIVSLLISSSFISRRVIR